ncbi:hypothetical protein C3L33_13310, partial [Rhododendron williamsianum]
MSHIPEEILDHIFSYITKNPDRNSASLVCKTWYKADRHSRHSVFVGNCYAVSPDRVIARFPDVRSLIIKGMPRVGDDSWVPRNWGGSVHNWVVDLAEKCPGLEELRLKRMVVLDETLVLISTKFPNFKSLVLISCVGFTGNGLDAIATNCRFLERLDLPKCKVGNDNGHWLSCFPESFTSLISLNFSCLRGAVNLLDLEKLVARCPNLRSLRLSKRVPLTTLSKIAMLAPQLVELGIGPPGFGPHGDHGQVVFGIGPHVAPQPVQLGVGPHVAPHGFVPNVAPQPLQLGLAPHVAPHDFVAAQLAALGPGIAPQLVELGIQHRQAYATLFEAVRNWKSIRSLSLSGSQVTFLRLLPISSICSKLISLDLSTLAQVVSSTCKDLRDLRLFQSNPAVVNGGATEEGLVAISKGCPLLHSLEFFCHQMTNAALITLSKNCPNITSFSLCIRESKKPDHVTLQPLDEGFGAIVQSCTGLRRLSLSGLLTDQVFLYIGMYGEQLEVLSATNAGDSDRGMLYVVNGCRNLRKLEVTDCPFGDSALLANVERYETMRCLYMSGCEVTLGGCKVLAKWVPSLNVEVINGRDIIEDYPDDRLRVKKLYVYRTLDGPRSDAPEHVWTL